MNSSERMRFERIQDPTQGNAHARRGVMHTIHGKVSTPMFMPVGTAGTVKGVTPANLKELGAQIILGNTYHLWLRPGIDVMKSVGGLRKWMGWDGPLLTDSGGFQVFSLAKIRKLEADGVRFQNHLDGASCFLSPELSIEIQEAIGSSIMMQLDVCPALPATDSELESAIATSLTWGDRCLAARKENSGALFGILQGGLDVKMRQKHLAEIVKLPFDGLALGGLSVGEVPTDMHRLLREFAHQMPQEKVRYLMGVGTPTDLLEAIASGVDVFDCVLPTRNARNGTLYSWSGSLHIRNARYAKDLRPICERCGCQTCRTVSRSYLRHLHQANEILASVYSSIHNLYFFIDLMRAAQQSIAMGTFESFHMRCQEDWRSKDLVLDHEA